MWGVTVMVAVYYSSHQLPQPCQSPLVNLHILPIPTITLTPHVVPLLLPLLIITTTTITTPTTVIVVVVSIVMVSLVVKDFVALTGEVGEDLLPPVTKVGEGIGLWLHPGEQEAWVLRPPLTTPWFYPPHQRPAPALVLRDQVRIA